MTNPQISPRLATAIHAAAVAVQEEYPTVDYLGVRVYQIMTEHLAKALDAELVKDAALTSSGVQP